MFQGIVNSLRNGLNTRPANPQQSEQVRPKSPDYLGTRDNLAYAGLSGNKINAESGNAYITEDHPSQERLTQLNLRDQRDRWGNFSLGSGNNSVGVSLARNQQVDESHPHAWVAMKTIVSHEQAAREYANHLALGSNDPRFVNAIDIAHVKSDQASYLFLERMTGGTAKEHLASVFRSTELSLDDKKEFMLDAVHGYLASLKAIHDLDRIHGDINIDNFFHDADTPRVAIGDFGHSREATPAQKIDEAVELGMMIRRDIRSEAVRAGVDVSKLDNVIAVLYGQHINPAVKQNPLGALLNNWAQIQPNHLIET